MQTWVSKLTLENLAKYAFAVEPMETDSELAHYPDFRRTARTGDNERAYYNIEQFKHFRINQVSERTGNLDSFDDTTQRFDSDREGFDATDVNIPQCIYYKD